MKNSLARGNRDPTYVFSPVKLANYLEVLGWPIFITREQAAYVN